MPDEIFYLQRNEASRDHIVNVREHSIEDMAEIFEGEQPKDRVVTAKSNSLIDVVVKLRDPWLQLAGVTLLKNEGFRVREIERGEVYIVTDDPLIKGDRVTRIIDNRPGPAQAALESLLACDVSGIITRENPSLLPYAVNAVANGMLIAPRSIFVAARSRPFLDRQQVQILDGVSTGLSNHEIARNIGTTEGYVKRCITLLFRQFDVTSRTALTSRTRDIGYQVRGR